MIYKVTYLGYLRDNIDMLTRHILACTVYLSVDLQYGLICEIIAKLVILVNKIVL